MLCCGGTWNKGGNFTKKGNDLRYKLEEMLCFFQKEYTHHMLALTVMGARLGDVSNAMYIVAQLSGCVKVHTTRKN